MTTISDQKMVEQVKSLERSMGKANKVTGGSYHCIALSRLFG
jgi:hypothetical protein